MGRFITAGLPLLLGLFLWFGNRDPGVVMKTISVEVFPGQQLTGRLYTPAKAEFPVPAMLMCHGLGSNKDTFAPLAWEFARHGMGAVVFDFGGYGESYRRPIAQSANVADGAVMLDWMAQQPELDAQNFGIIGHSMGGTTALETGRANESLKATIVLGIGGVATSQSPANLMFGTGVYEEFNPAGQMEQLFVSASGDLFSEASTGHQTIASPTLPSETIAPTVSTRPLVEPQAIANQTRGNFAQGTARRWSLSPTIDHRLTPYDRQLQEDSIRWAQASFGLEEQLLPLQTSQRMLGMGITVISLVTVGQMGLTWGMAAAGALEGANSPFFPRLYHVVLGILLLLSRWEPRGLLAGIVWMGLMTWSGIEGHSKPEAHSTLSKREPEALLKEQSRATPKNSGISLPLLYGLLVFSLILVAVLVNAVATGSLQYEPTAIFSLPFFLKNFVVGMAYHDFHKLRYLMLSPLGAGLVFGLVGLELWRPGLAKFGFTKLALKLLSILRQPISWDLGQVQWPVWLMLSGLLVLLGIVVHGQLEAGLLAGEAGAFVLRIFGCFVILPGLLGIGVIRSRWWQRLEQG